MTNQTNEKKARVPSIEEARQIMRRYNASHFNTKEEHARYTVPPDFNRDDDLLMEAFIDSTAELQKKVEELENYKKAAELVWKERDELQDELKRLVATPSQYQELRTQNELLQSQLSQIVERLDEMSVVQDDEASLARGIAIDLLNQLSSTPNLVKQVEDLRTQLETERGKVERCVEKLKQAQQKHRNQFARNVDELTTLETPYDELLSSLPQTTNLGDQPLKAEVQGERLVISIGLERLAFCAENDDGNPRLKVISQTDLGKDVCRAMHYEREDGSNLLTDLFDAAATKACEEGSVAFDPNQSIPER